MEKNKGFSLVELLITVTILSIVLLTVTHVMVSGSKSFTKGNADAIMQRQAQLVVNQMEDMLMDTNGGMDFTDHTDTKELVLYNVSDISGVPIYTKEVILWEKANEKLFYSKNNMIYDTSTGAYVDEDASTDPYRVDKAFLAEGIRSFSVDLHDTKKGYAKDGSQIDILQSVKIMVEYRDQNDQVSYATSPIVTLRNRMMLSAGPETVFENTPAATDTLSLYISSGGAGTESRMPIQDRVTACVKGSTHNIYAIVNSSNDVNSLVNWKIEETDSLSTISQDGVLTVADAEPNAYLTIVAAYKNNPSKSAKAVLLIPSKAEILSAKIVPVSYLNGTLSYKAEVETNGFDSAALASQLVYEWSVSDSSCVGSFDPSGAQLQLPIIGGKNNVGKNITITLKVSGGTYCKDEKTASILYRIPMDGDTSDSIQKRNTSSDYYFAITDEYRSLLEPPYEICFYDLDTGKKIDEYDALLSNITVKDVTPGHFAVEISDSLPKDVSYYLKVIIHCKNPYDSEIRWDYERIIYIYAEE